MWFIDLPLGLPKGLRRFGAVSCPIRLVAWSARWIDERDGSTAFARSRTAVAPSSSLPATKVS
jgi:hypothetical protein